MSELPEGWAETTLGEIVTLRGDKIDPGTIPDAAFIGLEDIEPHTSRVLKLGKASDVKSAVARFEAGDVLYSRLRPYLNKVTVPDFDGVASAEILALRPSGAIEAEFVRRRIMTSEFLNFAALLDKGDRPRVNFKEIATFPIALPPLPEQRRIVAKVNGLIAHTARARSELDRIPTLVARYKQRLLALAFSGERFNSRTTLDDISERVTKGESPGWQGFDYQEEGILFLRSQNVGWGKLLLDDQVFLDPTFNLKREKSIIRAGDVLLNIVGASIGRTAVATEEVVGANCNQAVAIIRLKERVATDQRFVCWWLQSPEAQGLIVEGAVDVARANFSLANIRAMNLPWPKQSERGEVVRRIESAFGWLDRVAANHAAAARLLPKLNAAILGKAFRGRLIPQDPEDEPASALLERIAAEREETTKRPVRRSPARGDYNSALVPMDAPSSRLADGRRPKARKQPMTKSRRDDDVWHKPYLARLLKRGKISDVQGLFRLADLPVDDFYKQLAWEIQQSHILDNAEELRAV